MHGQGTFTYSNGDIYEGELKDNKMHGQGTFTYAHGDKYEGGYNYGKFHGQGTITLADGTIIKKGLWENGKYVGE